ncbi:MAG: ABC transporter ATP-binding protein [Candidatus Heimdallarchaeota archaeon]
MLKQKNKPKSDMNLWSIYFVNPLAIKETEQFKKNIVKALKEFQPLDFHFEELTSFLLFNASFNTDLCSKKNQDINVGTIEETARKVLNEIRTGIDGHYNEYIITLVNRFSKNINKNRELKESINIINNKLVLTEEEKAEFSENVYAQIDNWTKNYFEIINKSTIYILDHFGCKTSIVEMSDIQFEIHSEKNITQLIDEMILFNFTKQYTQKSNLFFNEFNTLLNDMNEYLIKCKNKSKNFEEALNLLKGKSFETVDNIHDIRRQLARQNRAEDAIVSEVKEMDDASLEKIIAENSQKEEILEIVHLTDNANEAIQQWFENIRKIELLENYDENYSISKGQEKNILQFFTQMELLRIWSEFFYDISYFTIRKGKVVQTLDTTVKRTIETKAVLVVEDVYKTYRLPKSRVYALRGVSFEIIPGEFLAIMGPSGAGKTTLVNILTGLDSPDKGTVYLNGKNIAIMGDNELTEFRRDEIGLVFQFYQLFADLTALENVSMPAEMAKMPVVDARKKALEILRVVELEKFANQYPDKLSGGQQQRVAIARALINDPTLIVADQLTGDLDSVTGQQIIGYLRKINEEKGTTILLVTHNKQVATQADRILIIEDGEIIEEIDMAKLRTDE